MRCEGRTSMIVEPSFCYVADRMSPPKPPSILPCHPKVPVKQSTSSLNPEWSCSSSSAFFPCMMSQERGDGLMEWWIHVWFAVVLSLPALSRPLRSTIVMGRGKSSPGTRRPASMELPAGSKIPLTPPLFGTARGGEEQYSMRE